MAQSWGVRAKVGVAVTVGMALLILTADGAGRSPIEEKYGELGGPSGRLGTPASPESVAPDGVGKYRHFANGSIYWHPKTGAHAVNGLILQRWAEQGYEKGRLAYPTTDEIDTFDGGGKVSKFQGGELIWHSATNRVTEVRSTDLVVDLPFPPGQAWYVIQANAVTKSDSHGGPWAFCWDFDLAGKPQAQSNGALFTAAADGPILYVDQNYASSNNPDAVPNAVVQRLGLGRYASYLHMRKGSYSRHFGAGVELPQTLPEQRWPIAKSGTVLAEVGDVGAAIGAFHVHFCVTTKPDRPQFGPFESVPVAFRNYSVSTNEGRSWSYVQVGVPRQDQWLRREPRPGPSGPQINNAAAVISFGKVAGEISVAAGALPPAAGGKLNVSIVSAWGETLASASTAVAAGPGPWSFELDEVPAFNKLKVVVAEQGPARRLSGESRPFTLAPSGSATINVQIRN